VFAWTGGTSGTGAPSVIRLRSTPTPAWDALGPNGGTLPLPAGTVSISSPRLKFDAAGNPVMGAMAGVETSPGVWTGGTTVARFDGTNWQVGAGYRISSDSYANYSADMGFDLFEGSAVMAWNNGRASTVTPLVQRNTPAGWSAVGAGNGEVPQFYTHGLIDSTGWHSTVLATGGELYLAIVDRVNGLGIQRIQVLRYLR
jgi:hypothetical protein